MLQAATIRMAYQMRLRPDPNPNPNPNPNQVKVAETFIKALAAKLGKLPSEAEQKALCVLPAWAAKFGGKPGGAHAADTGQGGGRAAAAAAAAAATAAEPSAAEPGGGTQGCACTLGADQPSVRRD